jgi:hypothetical protein
VRRYLRYLFVLFLALDVAALVVLFQKSEGTSLAGILVDIRNALFTKFVSQSSELETPPSELIKQGMLTDPPEERAKWKEILNNFVRYHDLFQQLDQTPSTVEKAELITLSFSRNGSPHDADGNPTNDYTNHADLLFKICTIMEPRGCCSDHAQVFIALANVVGVDAMKVTCAHTTCAFYCPEFQKWVWIDPQFALLAKMPNGQYMSPLEVRDANLKGQPFDYEFFGTPDHLFAKMDPRSHEYYRPETFCLDFGVEWGNNELIRNKYDHRFLFLPKSIRQVFAIAFGLHPTYRYLDDDPLLVAKYFQIRMASYAVGFLFLIGNCAFPIYCFIEWLKGRQSRSAVASSARMVLPEIVLESQGRNLAV